MNYKDTIVKLQRLKGQWLTISKETGFPYGTLRKLADGTTKNPGIGTIDRLKDAIKKYR